jgi:predicted PurR-regulated permease PerM
MQESRYIRTILVGAALIVLYFVFRIFEPFLETIAVAVILASLCHPGFRWLESRLKGRSNLAALLTCLLIIAVIVVPFVGLTISLANQIGELYLTVQNRIEAGEYQNLMSLQGNRQLQPFFNWIGQYIDIEKVDLVGSLAALLRQASVFFLRHSTSFVSGTANLFGKLFIMLVTMFFLLRDGFKLLGEIEALSPLAGEYGKVIGSKLKQVTRATVLGSLLTALAQGLAGGIVFWFLGIPHVLVWFTLMTLFSLLPVVGTAIIWAPWAVYLIASGSVVKGVILIVMGVLVIGMIDNFLRPVFIEGQVGMHSLLVFFSIMGGIAYFGMSGMIFGPIIVSLGLTFLELIKLEFREELSDTLVE